jgi:hypothetical protein
MKRLLVPLVGEEVASALARTATAHKDTGAFSVSVPSGVLVLLGEKLAELAGRK